MDLIVYKSFWLLLKLWFVGVPVVSVIDVWIVCIYQFLVYIRIVIVVCQLEVNKNGALSWCYLLVCEACIQTLYTYLNEYVYESCMPVVVLI